MWPLCSLVGIAFVESLAMVCGASNMFDCWVLSFLSLRAEESIGDGWMCSFRSTLVFFEWFGLAAWQIEPPE